MGHGRMDGHEARSPWRRLWRMVRFLDLRIHQKVALFSAGTAFWFVLSAVLAAWSLLAVRDGYRDLIGSAIPAQRLLGRIETGLEALDHDAQVLLDADLGDLARTGARSRLRSYELAAAASALGRAGGGLEPPARLLRQRIEALEEAFGKLLEAARERRRGDAPAPRLGPVHDRFEQRLAAAHGALKQLAEAQAARLPELAGQVDATIRASLVALVVLFALEVGLLMIFARLITASIVRPINAIRRQIRALADGEAELTEKVEVMSRDEIGRLTEEFNELTEVVHDMTSFKQVIEDDESLEDVYMRLGEVFTDKLGVPEYAVLEVSADERAMVVVDPRDGKSGPARCHSAVLANCELCRARKTGHLISSLDYPGVCTQFRGAPEQIHVCIPVITGGRPGAVVQLLFAAPEGDATETIRTTVFKAETYIKQSQSVIEAKHLLQTLRESALKDSLTGLFNRRFLQEHGDPLINGVVRRGKNVGLLMCDLDFFKQVNDQYGHDAGDAVLRETATVIRDSVREADIVVRFGGEEFLVLLMDVEPGESVQVAEKIRANVAATKLRVNGATVRKNISIGVSEYPHDTKAFWHAIKFADVALYEAKRSGRNRVVRFEAAMWQEEAF